MRRGKGKEGAQVAFGKVRGSMQQSNGVWCRQLPANKQLHERSRAQHILAQRSTAQKRSTHLESSPPLQSRAPPPKCT